MTRRLSYFTQYFATNETNSTQNGTTNVTNTTTGEGRSSILPESFSGHAGIINRLISTITWAAVTLVGEFAIGKSSYENYIKNQPFNRFAKKQSMIASTALVPAITAGLAVYANEADADTAALVTVSVLLANLKVSDLLIILKAVKDILASDRLLQSVHLDPTKTQTTGKETPSPDLLLMEDIESLGSDEKKSTRSQKFFIALKTLELAAEVVVPLVLYYVRIEDRPLPLVSLPTAVSLVTNNFTLCIGKKKSAQEVILNYEELKDESQFKTPRPTLSCTIL